MPTISRFYGINVLMHQIEKEHNPPHVHIIHDGYRASIDINNFAIIEGQLKNTAYRLSVEFIYFSKKTPASSSLSGEMNCKEKS